MVKWDSPSVLGGGGLFINLFHSSHLDSSVFINIQVGLVCFSIDLEYYLSAGGLLVVKRAKNKYLPLPVNVLGKEPEHLFPCHVCKSYSTWGGRNYGQEGKKTNHSCRTAWPKSGYLVLPSLA